MTRSQDTSSDEEENIEVQEVSYDERVSENLHLSEPDAIEDNTLVEGDDYDVIQVYAVDPDLDLEASSDEEHEDFSINKDQDDSDGEYLTIAEDKDTYDQGNKTPDVLSFNLDTPVVSNVDEYFIKEDKDKDILAVKDEPVVNDVDEYFIKEEKSVPNVDDFFVKKPEEHVPNEVADEYFVASTPKVKDVQDDVPDVQDVPINESDLEVLPNIEELKRFLLEDMTYSKFKSAQRSCSLPQSPMHNICLDIDDAKTCLSFEDLNLDLSDLTFDNDKDKSANSNKSDDVPRALTDEDVNSFLITSKPETKFSEDDLSHQDMEIERPVENTVLDFCIEKTAPADVKPVVEKLLIENMAIGTPIIEKHVIKKPVIEKPIAEKPIIEKSIMKKPVIEKPIIEKPIIEKRIIKKPIMEKPIIKRIMPEKVTKKENGHVKIDDDEDLVDVESCNDVVIPVLEANNLNSLLEQFEATEKLNTKPKRPIVKPPEEKVKTASLTNGMRLQDAGVQLNKNKMRQILVSTFYSVHNCLGSV